MEDVLNVISSTCSSWKDDSFIFDAIYIEDKAIDSLDADATREAWLY